MRTQWKKGLRHPPVSSHSSPLYKCILQIKALSSLRQQGTDLRESAIEFSGAAKGLGFNDAALKDLFNHALDEPLNWWQMRGLDHLTFGEFVDFLDWHGNPPGAAPPEPFEDAAAPPEALPLMPVKQAPLLMPALPALPQRLALPAPPKLPVLPAPSMLPALSAPPQCFVQPAPPLMPTLLALPQCLALLATPLMPALPAPPQHLVLPALSLMPALLALLLMPAPPMLLAKTPGPP